MGWKTSMIVINSDKNINQEELLQALKFQNFNHTGKEHFDVAIYPPKGMVYVGHYKNNLVICVEDLPFRFLDNYVSEAENILCELFPDTEICALVLHSVVNLWGYSVCKNSQKIRARAGSHESGTMIEFGKPLPQENHLLSMSTVNADGNRVYRLQSSPNDEYAEDQVGENFVFELSSRYFGQSFASDDDFFEAQVEAYSYSSIS